MPESSIAPIAGPDIAEGVVIALFALPTLLIPALIAYWLYSVGRRAGARDQLADVRRREQSPPS